MWQKSRETADVRICINREWESQEVGKHRGQVSCRGIHQTTVTLMLCGIQDIGDRDCLRRGATQRPLHKASTPEGYTFSVKVNEKWYSVEKTVRKHPAGILALHWEERERKITLRMHNHKIVIRTIRLASCRFLSESTTGFRKD